MDPFDPPVSWQGTSGLGLHLRNPRNVRLGLGEGYQEEPWVLEGLCRGLGFWGGFRV